jgi:predicted Zn-dependent protease with MMP-like domain
MLPREEFEQLVAQALDELPPYFQNKMNNVEVLIEAWPSPEHLRTAGLGPGQLLIGLYFGVPLTQRTQGYTLVPLDTITLFQGPIEQVYRSPDRIRAGVQHTVVHKTAQFPQKNQPDAKQYGAL